MKTRQDFAPDMTPPRSIEELVKESLSSQTTTAGEPYPNLDIGELMKRVFSHIETEALKAYKSNQLWAIRAWTYENILIDATAKAAAVADENLLDELVKPVEDWRNQNFDPLRNLRYKLELAGRKEGYIKECMRPAIKLVCRYGKKAHYSEAELIDFMHSEQQHYCASSYATKCHQLKAFIDSLPEDERGRKQVLPIAHMPSYPDEYHQPSFSSEEIDKIIYAAFMSEKPDVVLRLAVAVLYGCRIGEIAKLISEKIDLDTEHDGANPTIDIPTEKKGKRGPQPIPKELLPLFSVPLEPRKPYKILTDLQRICRHAKVFMPHRCGIHAIRRSVVTALYQDTDLKEISIRRFMRWSLGSRSLGVMPRYVKTPVEVTDLEVLSKHPYVPMLKDMVGFIPYLPQYSCVHFTTIVARQHPGCYTTEVKLITSL